MGGHTRATACVGPLIAAAVVLLLAACGQEERTLLERAGLDSEYLSVASGDTCLILTLDQDGGFVVRDRERDCWSGREMKPTPSPRATGTWAFSDGRLDLDGDGWVVTFESDSTRVEVPARSDTISSLRWITSTDGSPFSACDLVSAAEFDEFLHPTEGSGSSGW